MIEVPLTKGKVAIIDDEDAERVLAFKWSLFHVKRKKELFYAHRVMHVPGGHGKQVTILLHRFILSAPKGLQVDHKNGDGLDNRRENLRLATNAQNHCNITSTRRNMTGFRGVSRQRHRFHSRIKFNSKQIEIGNFATAEDAARAYDAKAKELHGEFATLNFPD